MAQRLSCPYLAEFHLTSERFDAVINVSDDTRMLDTYDGILRNQQPRCYFLTLVSSHPALIV